MKRILVTSEKPEETIKLSEIRINAGTLIVAKSNGEIAGFVKKFDAGYMLCVGLDFGSNGMHDSLEKLLKSCESEFGYEFFIVK